MTQSSATPKPPATPRRLDPEDAQHALAEVQECLRRQHLVEDLVHRQEQGDDKAHLVEDLVHRQHEAELATLINGCTRPTLPSSWNRCPRTNARRCGGWSVPSTMPMS